MPPDCLASLTSVQVATRGSNHRCPASATGLKSSLQSWIFHLSISESMFCSFLPGQGLCISVFFHHSSSSHIFFNLFPLCLPSWNHTPLFLCSVFLHFLFFSLIAALVMAIWSLTQTKTIHECFHHNWLQRGDVNFFRFFLAGLLSTPVS